MENGEGSLPQELESKKPLLYHHARPLEFVEYGTVTQKLGIDEDFDSSYRWLENEVGFPPLFMAVGKTEEDVRMTGYSNQWARILSWSSSGNEYRKKGEAPNQVLFSYSDIPNGVFTDYNDWHIVLNSSHKQHNLNKWEKKLIFRKTWDSDKWLAQAEKHPHTVQLVVPELDLTKADAIFVRNKETQKKLQKMGFKNVQTRRMLVQDLT